MADDKTGELRYKTKQRPVAKAVQAVSREGQFQRPRRHRSPQRFALVEAPETMASKIIDVLGRARIKGQKVVVRLFGE
ncbi:MAG: hypothetical protein OEV08_03240 [Nitrospira sp.]|nr:hypothetical protein [Nitrospira sp.]